MLRNENTDLYEMVDNLKQKLHQKTVEANRFKKKAQQLEKATPEKEPERRLSALDELLHNER